MLDANGSVIGLELQYNHGTGQGWSGATPLPSQGGLLSWSGKRWGALGVDKNNVLQVVWNGAGGEVWYASKWQIRVDVGRCGFTEFYDTQNLRIYYTRTYPNVWVINPSTGEKELWALEEDCRLWPSAGQLGVAPNLNDPLPLDSASGYPRFVVILGAGLENAYAKYAGMGYSVNRVPQNSSSRRYPVYISSDPIWTDIPLIGGIMPIKANITLPDHMFITRGTFYTAAELVSVDWLRTQGTHEFFHAVQWTFVPNAGATWAFNEDLRWWMEATAVWAAPKVYPQNGQYPRNLDDLLRVPYASLIPQALASPRAYGSFILATYLRDKVANSDTIIRQIWQQYKSNGGNAIAAIDQVLQSQYSTTLASEFPKFTWNNYFLNDGTYVNISPTGVYTDVTYSTTLVSMPDWQLFRSHLRDGRENYLAGNAGVFTDPRITYPGSGPSAGYSRFTGSLGVGYLEFMRPSTITANAALSVTLTLYLPDTNPEAYIRTSILPIANFSSVPHPGNQMLTPVFVNNMPTPTYRQTFRVAKFDQCNRVAVIVNNINRYNPFQYEYIAEVIPPIPQVSSPCALVVP